MRTRCWDHPPVMVTPADKGQPSDENPLSGNDLLVTAQWLAQVFNGNTFLIHYLPVEHRFIQAVLALLKPPQKPKKSKRYLPPLDGKDVASRRKISLALLNEIDNLIAGVATILHPAQQSDNVSPSGKKATPGNSIVNIFDLQKIKIEQFKMEVEELRATHAGSPPSGRVEENMRDFAIREKEYVVTRHEIDLAQQKWLIVSNLRVISFLLKHTSRNGNTDSEIFRRIRLSTNAVPIRSALSKTETQLREDTML